MKIIIKILLLFSVILFLFPLNIYSQWYSQNSNVSTTLYSVDFLDTLNGYVSGNQGVILKSTDGGSTWVSLTSGVSDPLYSISFFDTQNGCAAGGAGNGSIIIRTTNGGTNWTQISSPANSRVSYVQFINSAIGFLITLSGQCLGSTNGGLTWTILNNQISTYGSHNNAFFINASAGYVAEDGGYLSKTTDGGYTWFDSWNGITTSDPLFGIQFSSSLNGFTVGANGSLYVTTNGAVSWSPVYNDTSTTNYYCVSAINANTSYAGGQFGKIIGTTDQGYNWFTEPSGVNMILYGIQFVTPNNGWIAGQNGVILHTNNGGAIGIKKISNDVPVTFSLSQNYPNPFNPSTNIKFDISKTSFAKLMVYDETGKLVETLLNQKLNPGNYEITWNAAKYASGVYFYRLLTDGFEQTKKMILAK